jgi:indolepyruvate ferredoxin oxidoreductase beta subunit
MDGSIIATDRPICIAIMAMGGQGGGVLADWIVALAESSGWIAQSTSVPGVAQRTGATIYYVEIIRPRPSLSSPSARPVLSLLPVPGNVDVVIAAEMMEAGRAIQRGLVSPGRTVLIASSHRALSVPEKAKPGDGIADPTAVMTAAYGVSARFVVADMQALAERAGSVISASLFGALAGSAALPFGRAEFEATIRASGVSVEASLRAFNAGFDAIDAVVVEPVIAPPAAPVIIGGDTAERAELARALARIDAMPQEAHAMLRAGLGRVVDYLDVAYGHEYLDRVSAFTDPALLTEAAKQIAVALSYDDVVRVADLKTRAARFARVRREVLARDEQLVATTEFMHPRAEEIISTMPRGLGLAFERSPALTKLLRLVFDRGRRLRTTSLSGFVPLWLMAGLRPYRRSLLRHGREIAHVDAWLALVAAHVPTNPALALELLKCRRLVKGYSDTHARGLSKFDRVIAATPMLAGRPDAADWIRRLRDAALADEDGKTLDGALATVATL